ncbi:MAG TPA: hypothetical protein VKY74_10000 [Chloroflexia bacterium]|nr:hypothetical protein [Chloroflexia bacterium]
MTYTPPPPGPPDPGAPPNAYPPPGTYAPPGSYAGPPAAAPPRGRPRWLLWGLGCLGLLVVACALFFAFTFFLATGLTQAMATSGDNFMNAMKAGNYDQAYALSTPALQQKVVNAAGLETIVKSRQPTSWSWSSRNVNNNSGQLSGSVTFVSGTSGTVDLTLQKVGNDWLVDGFQLNP